MGRHFAKSRWAEIKTSRSNRLRSARLQSPDEPLVGFNGSEYLVHRLLDHIWFAGVTTPDAGDVTSFTIITGGSAGMLADYHTRAPLILEPEAFDVWMDPANDPAEVMADCRSHRFERVG